MSKIILTKEQIEKLKHLTIQFERLYSYLAFNNSKTTIPIRTYLKPGDIVKCKDGFIFFVTEEYTQGDLLLLSTESLANEEERDAFSVSTGVPLYLISLPEKY